MENNQIVSLFLSRSEDAISETTRKYGGLMQTIAKNILGNDSDAQECVNDALLGLWNTIPPQNPDALGSYACKIVRNIAVKKYCYNTAKKRNSFYDAAIDELAECIPSKETAESELDAKELGELLNRFLASIDKSNRIIFVRRYWHSDSIKAIAELTGEKEHSVCVKLSRTRQKLRKFLEREEFFI